MLSGSVRMRGVLPTEDLAVVPAVVVRFADEQLSADAAERCRAGTGQLVTLDGPQDRHAGRCARSCRSGEATVMIARLESGLE